MSHLLTSLAGVTIRQPNSMGYEWYHLTKSGRVASGKMVIDIIARKKKFTLTYDYISGPEMDKILAIVHEGVPFFELKYTQNRVPMSAIVYAGAKKATPFRFDGNIWYWKPFTFDLIEQ